MIKTNISIYGLVHCRVGMVTYIDTESSNFSFPSFFPIEVRPDIAECGCDISDTHEGKTHFVLKAHGADLTERAAEALYWVQEQRYKCTVRQSIARNCTFLRFELEKDAAIFKLFWL